MLLPSASKRGTRAINKTQTRVLVGYGRPARTRVCFLSLHAFHTCLRKVEALVRWSPDTYARVRVGVRVRVRVR
eukprot:700358-Prorocentrum_minimum.AAC.1